MRRVSAALIPAVLLVGLGLSTVASAHDGGEHLHFIAKATSFEKIDLGDKGRQVVVTFDVFEHHHENDTAQVTPQDHREEGRAGHGTGTCVSADPGEGALCSASIELDEGQLSMQGIVHVHSHRAADHNGDHGSITLPVTGGSGKFFAVAGEVKISHAGKDSDGHDHTAAFAASPSDHTADPKDHVLHLAFHLVS